MPRKINALAVAAGKLILAIQKESHVAADGSVVPDYEVMNRAQTLQHAAHNDCVRALLVGRSVAEYFGAAWIEMHPTVKPFVDAFASELNTREHA
jgi:hypothetical protein